MKKFLIRSIIGFIFTFVILFVLSSLSLLWSQSMTIGDAIGVSFFLALLGGVATGIAHISTE